MGFGKLGARGGFGSLGSARGGSTTVTIPSGLVLYWPFDNSTTSGGNTTDISATNETGVLTGVTSGTSGKVLQAFTFAGGSSYVTGTGAPVTGYPFSMGGWVQLASTALANNTDEVIAAIVQKSSITEFWLSYFTVVGSTANTIRMIAQSGGLVREARYTLTVDTAFHHIMAVFTDATTFVLYVDGVAVTTAITGTANTPSSLDTMYVGNFLYNTSNVYQGLSGIIDDVRVYNRTLSASDVLAIYNAGVAGTR